MTSPIYHKDVMELLTVAVEYCAYLEQADQHDRYELLDTMSKLLPLLYLKGTMLPEYESLSDDMPADYVTEENYNIIRTNIAYVMGEQDDYLDVFVEDMRYSDTPILMTISENLADIYQDLKNFAYIYKIGVEDQMMAAIEQCKQNFKTDWGQKLANVLRAIHEVKYSLPTTDIDE
ncbi:MAG: DUF5063 domain-containing protein [Bacteroidaceae bacterium]|nr:DUF5063 domain-containing protein [Bacteroidaceae bacterium]MBR1377547.1 DUF5063 domain-containing protein [Bacteroidaceae bacterium]